MEAIQWTGLHDLLIVLRFSGFNPFSDRFHSRFRSASDSHHFWFTLAKKKEHPTYEHLHLWSAAWASVGLARLAACAAPAEGDPSAKGGEIPLFNK